MSTNRYCCQCGAPSPKTANFCSSCGTPFVAGKTAIAAKVIPVETDDDDEIIAEIPDISALDVEINQASSRGVKLKEVLNEAISNPEPIHIKRPKNKLSKKAAMAQFQKEAGNSKQSINIGGEH